MGLLTRIFKAISHEISKSDIDEVVRNDPYTETVEPVEYPPVIKDAPQDNQILTRAETRLFNALTNVIDTQLYIINLKTRLKDANLATIHEKNNDHSLLAMHIDFLLIDINELNPVLAIELDDSSHNSTEATIKDNKKNNFLKLN